ncbi:hypothetical protein DFH11DRAFT_812550 [Phellopilus nigrolimitatus]|nr:hypothetical protein DFH11DRAFT_812550 [Phellopilus nigrolimitatus]
MQVALGEIPFGGVGESGYGYQLLKWGFDGYTHMRGIMDMPKEAEPFLSIRYPPHTEENTKLLGSNCFKPVGKFD